MARVLEQEGAKQQERQAEISREQDPQKKKRMEDRDRLEHGVTQAKVACLKSDHLEEIQNLQKNQVRGGGKGKKANERLEVEEDDEEYEFDET